MKLIANMVVYNEEEFVESAIRSTIDYVDQMIITEGAWKEFLDGNPGASEVSSDQTCKIISRLISEYGDVEDGGKILAHHASESSQLEQRNVYFEYAPKEPHVMLLQDGDEVWTKDEIEKIKIISQHLPAYHSVRVQSLVFINDLENVSKVEYPRVWSIPEGNHKFIEPNRIVSNELEYKELPTTLFYFHYSYCHNPERFQQKKNERTALHGFFPWDLNKDKKIVRPDANIEKFEGKHPELIFKYGRFAKKQ